MRKKSRAGERVTECENATKDQELYKYRKSVIFISKFGRKRGF